MPDNMTIAFCVDRMAQIKMQQAELKAESDAIEAELLKQFEADVEDTKYKTVVYSGNNAKVTATYADSVKLIYPYYLKKIFGEAYGDIVTEETTYRISSHGKRMLTAMYKGEYVKDTDIGQTVRGLDLDDKTTSALLKKLKGKNFETDKNNLIKIGKLSESEASDTAYLISEAAAWQSFIQLLAVTGDICQARIDETLKCIENAITVEETPKISVETK